MWRFIIVTITLALTTVVGRPLDAMEDPWLTTNLNKIPKRIHDNDDDAAAAGDRLLRKWRPDNIDYDDGITDYKDAFDPNRNPYIKRGFSILARWKPFSNIGKQRTSIREANRIPFNNDLDIVSAETRAMLRPVGQPLRWG